MKLPKSMTSVALAAMVAIALVGLAALATNTVKVSAHVQPVQQDCLAETGTIGDPHAAVTPTFTSIGQTSATVNWIDNCNDEDSFAVFLGGVSQGNLSANTTSANLTGLTCATQYTVYVRATKTAGINIYTSDSLSAQFTTAACGTLDPVCIGAAPSIAAAYLKDQGIKSGSTLYKNIISLIAHDMNAGEFDEWDLCDEDDWAGYIAEVNAQTAHWVANAPSKK
jgi:hypothetical protein